MQLPGGARAPDREGRHRTAHDPCGQTDHEAGRDASAHADHGDRRRAPPMSAHPVAASRIAATPRGALDDPVRGSSSDDPEPAVTVVVVDVDACGATLTVVVVVDDTQGVG